MSEKNVDEMRPAEQASIYTRSYRFDCQAMIDLLNDGTATVGQIRTYAEKLSAGKVAQATSRDKAMAKLLIDTLARFTVTQSATEDPAVRNERHQQKMSNGEHSVAHADRAALGYST